MEVKNATGRRPVWASFFVERRKKFPVEVIRTQAFDVFKVDPQRSFKMTLAEINDWFTGFLDTVIEGRVKVRNRIFCGAHIEIFEPEQVSIVMEQGLNVPLNASEEQKALDFVKRIFLDDRLLICNIPTERFEKIVRGEDTIKEDDWFWSDEESPNP